MQPTRVIAVDWSGARTGEARKIWLAEIAVRDHGEDARAPGPAGAAGAASLVRLCDGWTREAMTAELVRVVHEARDSGQRIVIGLDFSFGFPAWYAQRHGWRDGREMWDAWTAERVEQTLSAPAFPFWGRGMCRAKHNELHDQSDTPPLRATERDNARTGPRPFSVFQLVGAGAVGVGSLRGMATLRALSEAGAAIWPFDTGFEARHAIVLEIWPRLYAPMVNKSNAADRLQFVQSLPAWQSLVWSDPRPSVPSARHGVARPVARPVACPVACSLAEAAVSRSDDAFDALMGAMALWSARAELAQLPPAAGPTERIEGRIWRPAAVVR